MPDNNECVYCGRGCGEESRYCLKCQRMGGDTRSKRDEIRNRQKQITSLVWKGSCKSDKPLLDS